MSEEETKDVQETEVSTIGKIRKTCSTCDKRIYVEPSRVTCPICHTPFVTHKKVLKAQAKAEKKVEREQKKAQKKAVVKEKKERKVKEVPADLIKKVSTLYPAELKSSTSIMKKIGGNIERKMIQRAMRAIDKG